MYNPQLIFLFLLKDPVLFCPSLYRLDDICENVFDNESKGSKPYNDQHVRDGGPKLPPRADCVVVPCSPCSVVHVAVSCVCQVG